MRHSNLLSIVGLIGLVAAPWSAQRALADPCGMVPPIYVSDNTSLVRVGDEQTYVFFKDGLETFVIRPGFSGKGEDFGMEIDHHLRRVYSRGNLWKNDFRHRQRCLRRG